jgi:hypothetical protein
MRRRAEHCVAQSDDDARESSLKRTATNCSTRRLDRLSPLDVARLDSDTGGARADARSERPGPGCTVRGR